MENGIQQWMKTGRDDQATEEARSFAKPRTKCAERNPRRAPTSCGRFPRARGKAKPPGKALTAPTACPKSGGVPVAGSSELACAPPGMQLGRRKADADRAKPNPRATKPIHLPRSGWRPNAPSQTKTECPKPLICCSVCGWRNLHKECRW